MQRISAEEEPPINQSFCRNQEEESELVNHNWQAYNCYQNQKKEEKSKCLLNDLQKRFIKYLTVLFTIFLLILACQICAKFYLHHQRASQYNHNLSLLKQYQFQQVNHKNNQQLQKGNNDMNMDNQTFVPFSRKDNQSGNGNISQQPTNQQILRQANKLRPKDQNQLQSPIDETSNQISSNVLNNHFDFQSDLVQDNLMISTHNPQIIFPPVQPKIQPESEGQIPLITYKKQITDPQINYENYTGITISQLQKSKAYLEMKYFQPLQTNTLIDSQRQYYEDKYKVSQYEQLPICVVIPTYNNAVNNRHINNMKSILMQEYSNYHIVFIDDASTDSTSDDIIGLMQKQTKLPPSRYLLVKNQQQMRAMHNLRTAAKDYCQPKDIFIIVDGDDQLIGRQVFKLFNAMFQSSGAWFVYSNFLTIDSYVGFSRLIPKSIIQANDYRKYPFVTSHLRAFYTQLFLNIKEQDLRDKNGEYLKAANDVAICIPILEQAQNRVTYIPEITYFYNSETGLNNHHLRLREQKRNDYRLRSKPKYKRVDKL